MNKSGHDNRSVRNTRRRLRDGLLQLLEVKPIHDVSVKELTELVDVNRGTFYFHYQDIYDLLHRIEDDFFEQFDRTLGEDQAALQSIDYPYLHAVFSFLGENKDFCRIMLGPNGDMQFVERVKARVDTQCSYFWERIAPEADRQRFGMYNAFIINGCIGLIQEWLGNNRAMTEEDVTHLTATIILASVGPCIA